MDVFLTSYGAAFTRVVLWYPYRDMVKAGYQYGPTPTTSSPDATALLSPAGRGCSPTRTSPPSSPSQHQPCTCGYVAEMRQHTLAMSSINRRNCYRNMDHMKKVKADDEPSEDYELRVDSAMMAGYTPPQPSVIVATLAAPLVSGTLHMALTTYLRVS